MAPPTTSSQIHGDDENVVPTKSNPTHFLLIPVMAQGHLIPMLDLARLLATRGYRVTFVTTPVNLTRIRPLADIASTSSIPLRFLPLPFPTAAVGLPDGCENVDLVRSGDLVFPFMRAMFLLRDPLENHLRSPDPERWPPPDCIISHTLHYWAADVARSLAIPRLSFQTTSCFYLTCSRLLEHHRAELQLAAAGGAPFLIPGLTQPIRVTMNQAFPPWFAEPAWNKMMEDIRAADAVADGVIVNTFEELEHWYLESYRGATGKLVWPVGPLSLYKEEAEAKAARGKASSVKMDAVVRWLDRRKAGSVVLVSSGSVARNTLAQLMQIGYGLEDSGLAFVWAIKEARDSEKVAGWAAEMEERIGERGLIIKGWMPQVTILSHAAVGGFVTHCGWNSTLEAVAAGVPMATWPHFYDQFLNERLVVDVLRVGVEVGVREPTAVLDAEGSPEEVKVTREQLRKALARLMDSGEEGEERRQRARDLGEKARRAMEEAGSSSQSLKNIIRFVNQKNNPNNSI